MKRWIRPIVSVLLLAILGYQLGAGNIFERLSEIKPSFILFAWLYYVVCQIVSSYRWQLLLEARGVSVKLTKLLNFYMVGMFMNNFLPGAVGGDVVKGYDLYRLTGNSKIAAASVFLERFTGLVGLSVISVAAIIILPQNVGNWVILVSVAGAAAILLLITLFFWNRGVFDLCLLPTRRWLPERFISKLEEFYTAIADYRSYPKTLFSTVVISVVVQLMFGVYYYLGGLALGLEIPLQYFILFLPIITLVSLLPFSYGGLGLREVVMALLFESVGYNGADVVAISIFIYLVNTVLSAWGGVLLLIRPRNVDAASAELNKTQCD